MSGLILFGFARQAADPLHPFTHTGFTWLAIGEDFHADLGLQLDPLSLMMMLIVTGVGSLIHIYSWGYMKGDPGFSRYFAFLSLFMFSMLGIVLADNFLMMFIFWELVGVSSYLLIGFWYEKRLGGRMPAKKAFLTNRIGDFGFLMLGIPDCLGDARHSAERLRRTGRKC